MKQLTIFLLFFPMLSFAQKKKGYWIKQSSIVTMNLVAGFAEGQREVCRNDYSRYARVHPNANPQWANPKVSFVNKYKHWPDDKREKYPGAFTVLAWTTDKHHFNGTLRNVLIVGGTGVSLSLYEKPKPKQIIIQMLVNWMSFATGTGIAHAIYKP